MDPNPVSSGAITFTAPHTAATINFGGDQPGTAATLYLVLTGTDPGSGAKVGDTIFHFSYQLVNTSDLTVNPFGRASGFGFDDATTTSSGAKLIAESTKAGTNGFTDIVNGANISGGTTSSISASLINNAQGGKNGGATVGTSANGTFDLTYAGSLSSIVLGDFMVRYQSLGLNASGSGIGTPITSSVPEPATWGLLLASAVSVW